MKKTVKLIVIAIIVTIMLIIGNNSYAENKTISANETNTTSNKKIKSDNAKLSNLGIKPNDFSGFKPSKTKYEVKVPLNVEEVEVYATAEDLDAKIKGTGKKQLNEGLNQIEVTVTAEDGTEKIYTIEITREGIVEEEKIENEGLSSLQIENIVLEPEFQTNCYEYKVEYIGELTTLNITATPIDESYIVEISGNENLQEGENIITILVSNAKQENIATYQLTINKSLKDYEAIAKEEEEQKIRNKTIAISTVVAVVVIIIIGKIIITLKRKKSAKEIKIPYSRTYLEEVKNEYSKEEAKQEFLSNYNNSYEEEKQTKTKKRKSEKGKRFK